MSYFIRVWHSVVWSIPLPLLLWYLSALRYLTILTIIPRGIFLTMLETPCNKPRQHVVKYIIMTTIKMTALIRNVFKFHQIFMDLPRRLYILYYRRQFNFEHIESIALSFSNSRRGIQKAQVRGYLHISRIVCN